VRTLMRKMRILFAVLALFAACKPRIYTITVLANRPHDLVASRLKWDAGYKDKAMLDVMAARGGVKELVLFRSSVVNMDIDTLRIREKLETDHVMGELETTRWSIAPWVNGVIRTGNGDNYEIDIWLAGYAIGDVMFGY